MFTSLAAAVLSVVCQADDAVAQDPVVDLKAELAGICAKAAAAESYRFEVKTEGTGGGGFGRGGRGGGEGGGEGGGRDARPADPISGEFRTGLPMHLKQGDVEAYLANGTLVHRSGAEGEWQLLDPEALRGGFGRGGRGGDGGGAGAGAGGGAGAGAGGGAGGSGGAGAGAGGGAAGGAGASGGAGADAGGSAGAGAGGDAGAAGAGGADAAGGGSREGGGRGGRSGFALFGLSRATPPHELLKDIDSKVEEVSRTDGENGAVVYSGKLSKEAADALASLGFGRGGRGGRGGGGFGDGEGPARQVTGSFEITAVDGVIRGVVLSTHLSMTLGERTLERDSKATYGLADWNAVNYEIPEGALVHFEF